MKYDHPIWTNLRHDLKDGKYFDPSGLQVPFDKSREEYPPYFPGYIESEEHPFTFTPSLTHVVPGTMQLSNKWAGTDGPKQFEKNKAELGPNWKYATKDITYDVNASGFRTREWKDIDWANSIVVLGCSCTFGVGLAEDEIMTSLLEKELNRPVINLGVPGGGNGVMMQISSMLINKFPTPYGVVINWSTPDRFRQFFKNGYHDVGAWDAKEVSGSHNIRDSVNISLLWQNRYINRYNELCEAYYDSKITEAMWKGRTKKYATMSFFPHTAHYMRVDKFVPIESNARDLLHPGASSHELAAKWLIDEFKSL